MYVITLLLANKKKAEVVYNTTNFMEAVNELENLALDTIYNKEGSTYFEKGEKFFTIEKTVPSKPIIKNRGYYAVIERFKSFVYYKNKPGIIYSGDLDLICTFEFFYVKNKKELQKRTTDLSEESTEIYGIFINELKEFFKKNPTKFTNEMEKLELKEIELKEVN